MMNDSCYLCGSADLNVIHGKVRDVDGVLVMKCNDCGLVFLSSFDHINSDFYENSGIHTSEQPIDEWIKDTNKDDERRISKLYRVYHSSILDFGAGNCNFIRGIGKLAVSAVAIEPESRVISELGNTLRSEGIGLFGSTDGLLSERSDAKFDFITMFHVIEHLQDPGFALIQLGDLLVDGGRIVIETPNANDALLGIYDCEVFKNFSYWGCHLFLFNEQTLGNLARKCGFKVVASEQVQRYPLSNHLYWLSHGLPGGHEIWPFNGETLNNEYVKELKKLGACDTIWVELEKA